MKDTVKILIDSILVNNSERSFDYLTLIVGIIAFAGVVLSSITLWKVQQKTFKDEYYKKIIDRRLYAYDQLEKIINLITPRNETLDRKDFYHVVFRNLDSFKNFYFKFMQLGSIRHWYSVELYLYYYDLNKKFNDILSRIEAYPHDTIKIGIEYFDEFNKYGLKLRYFLIQDLNELHNVKDFLKNLSEISKDAMNYEKI